jgi:L-2-hydroxyglutarate oxidase LhgO
MRFEHRNIRSVMYTLSSRGVEWQSSGSLLLASTEDEVQQLLLRRELLRGAGIEAQFLSATALHTEEPALCESLPGGLLVSSDSQLVCLHLPDAPVLPPGE